MTQFLTDEDAEGGRLIYLAVAEEVAASGHPAFQGQEYGLYDIRDIDEGDVLRLIANGKVGMSLDALEHHVVVALPGTIDTRRTQNDVG